MGQYRRPLITGGRVEAIEEAMVPASEQSAASP